jgi:hypothetical protein
MYPQAESLVRLHSHTDSAPYIKSVPGNGGITIKIWQDPNHSCAIQSVSIRLNWTRSFGLMVTRYRMTFLAWTMGLGALVIAGQFRQYRLTGEWPFSNFYASRLNTCVRRIP